MFFLHQQVKGHLSVERYCRRKRFFILVATRSFAICMISIEPGFCCVGKLPSIQLLQHTQLPRCPAAKAQIASQSLATRSFPKHPIPTCTHTQAHIHTQRKPQTVCSRVPQLRHLLTDSFLWHPREQSAKSCNSATTSLLFN